jgi:phosphomevalonate kinase
MKTISVRTGGKLYIAGEYAILTPGQTAILKNIPIPMTAIVKEAEKISLFSDMFDYATDMTADKNYALIQQTIVTLATYLDKSLHDLPAFKLDITGKLERDGKKFGIGSSGSVTVLTLKALSAFYELKLSADTIFKLASYTLLKLGDNGSMGDIACIAYDDLVAFTSFDRQKVSTWIATEDIKTVLAKDWGYRIEIIKPALLCDFLVGWTKQPSISKDMINLVKSAITRAFLEDTERNVQICKQALQMGDKMAVKASLQKVSDLLLGLSSAIYNDKLKALKSAEKGLDVIAKSSGSGGGDCGIAISFSESDSHELAQRWQKAGIEILYQERLSDER